MFNFRSIYKFSMFAFIIMTQLAYANIEELTTEMNSAGTVVSAWKDDFYTGSYEIVAATLPPGGPWGTPTTISSGTTGMNASNPKIAINTSGNIVVVWYAYNTVSSYYSLYGATWDSVNGWSSASQISGNEHVYNNYQVRLSNANEVVVVWNAFSFITFLSTVKSVNGSFATISSGTWPTINTVT